MQGFASATVALMASVAVAIAAGGSVRSEQFNARSFVGVLDEHAAIQYAVRPTRDRVSALNNAIAQGAVSLAFQEQGGYLRSVLEALRIPVESQLLVFSKSGIQRALTGPRNPRAIFFDDSTVVGYVPGATHLELATHDPEQGVVFYTIDQKATEQPAFTRQTACLTCHVSSSTMEVPGMIARSSFTTADGGLMPQLGIQAVNHRTPLLQRWGGWYVTGDYTPAPYGGIVHMGNVTTEAHPESGPSITSNQVFIQWLNSAPETRGYPSADSDISSLMVFDHQAHAVNLLTRLNWETRVAASQGRPDFANGTLGELVKELTDYLLFVDEAPPPTRLTPRPGFAERFTNAGPRDRQGRSLGELDLERRLLRYPCSYMVYTKAFESLPAPAKHAVYRRMWTVLSGQDTRAAYSHLWAADRRAIIEILRDTKSDLPEVFR